MKFIVLLGAWLLPCSFALGEERPNVVILFTDDQGTLDAGCYGSKDLHTPNMDSLAKTGVRFTQAYSHTVCCPARAALMTGRHPQRSRVNSWAQRSIMDPEGVNMKLSEVTLAEALKGAGYRTALFGKWHLGAHRDYGPTKQGFNEFFGIRDGFIDNYNHFYLHREGFHDLFEGTKEVWAKGKFFPEMVVDRSLKFIEQNKDKPFFLYLAFNIPHYPEQALKPHLERYSKLSQPRRTYAAFVTTTDYYVGKVLEKLDALKLRKNTIIILMSDNGHSAEDYQIRSENHKSGYPKGHNYGANGGGGNTGKWIGNKGTFFEGGIRVPAMISYPAKLPQNVKRDQAVTVMDWYPTVLDLCKVAPPKVKLDGHSLLPVIRSEKAPSPHKVLYFQWQNRWAVRKGEWKLIGSKGNKPDAKERVTLHRLTDEKPEVTNHVQKNPKKVAELRQLYSTWKADVFADSK